MLGRGGREEVISRAEVQRADRSMQSGLGVEGQTILQHIAMEKKTKERLDE